MISESTTTAIQDWEVVTVSDENVLFGGEENVLFAAPATEIPGNLANPQQLPTDNGNKKINIGKAIPAKMVIGGADKALSALISLCCTLGGIDVSRKEASLTTDEKKFLEDPVQDYLDTIDIQLTPLDNMLIAIGTVYIGKTVEIVEKKMNEPSKPKKEKVKDGEIDLNNLSGDKPPKRAYKPRVKKDSTDFKTD